MLSVLIQLTERGMIPDPLLRMGIRKLCGTRLNELNAEKAKNPESYAQYAEMLKNSPIAIATQSANEQHYEVPAEFFLNVLGPNRKYSCAYWPEGCTSLEEAEKLALEITMERAELRDGMNILELGCGWGSLTIAMAKKFPNAKITAVSNSTSQKTFIDNLAWKENLKNIEVLTHDVSQLVDLGPGRGGFDRVVSVEMFEHFRNYEVLLGRINSWLAPEGKLFVHIFTHKQFPYLFETEGEDNWMGKYFFTGGQMPSHSLLSAFQKDLKIQKEWAWDGTHYQKTSEAWLKKMDVHRYEVMGILTEVYGADAAVRWFFRWRMFFLAVAELFGYNHGTEWGVSHYLLSKKG